MAYCSVDDVRSLTGLSAEEIDDTTLDSLIDEAAYMLEKLSGKKFTTETVEEKFPCRKTIHLKSPVQSIEYVKADNYTLQSSNYVLFEDNGLLVLLIDCRYFNTVTVKYTYGYSSIPSEVKQLNAYLAGLLAYIRLSNGEAKVSVGGLKVEYAKGSRYAEKIEFLKEKVNQLLGLIKQSIFVG